MIQFFARVVELREEKSVKCDGKITMDFPSREFLEVTKRSTFGSYTFFPLYYSKRSLFNFVMLCKSKSYPKLRFGIAFPFWFFYCSKLRKEV